MWRQTSYPQNPDSDQSVSDEEDIDGDSSTNFVPLGGRSGREDELQILSQLEKLRDDGGISVAQESLTSCEQQINIPLEDDVEVPEFGDNCGFIASPKSKFMHQSADDEVISDDEESTSLVQFSILSSHERIHKPLPVAAKEATASVHSIRSELCSSSHVSHSRANLSLKASKGRAKPKFSFGFVQKGERRSCTARDTLGAPEEVHEQPEISEDIKGIYPVLEVPDSPEYINPENNEQSGSSNARVLGHEYVKHSMAELLDGLHDLSSLPKETREMPCRNGGQRMGILRIGTSVVVDGTTDGEEQPEAMSSESPSEDESNFGELKIPISDYKWPTVADRIQEVLDSSSLNPTSALISISKQSGTGLFGKLQQAMQTEKESELEFLKMRQAGGSLSGTSCIDVLILSRYLDAKLTVCLCSPEQNQQGPVSSHHSKADSKGSKRTIIFNPRVCSDVDLETGNTIRIYPPWKEVQVMGCEGRIILATYFSHACPV